MCQTAIKDVKVRSQTAALFGGAEGGFSQTSGKKKKKEPVLKENLSWLPKSGMLRELQLLQSISVYLNMLDDVLFTCTILLLFFAFPSSLIGCTFCVFSNLVTSQFSPQTTCV